MPGRAVCSAEPMSVSISPVIAAALVAVLVQHHGGEPARDRLRGRHQQVVAPIAGQRHGSDRLAWPDIANEPAGRLERRRVVPVVDDDRARPDPEHARPARVVGTRLESRQAAGDVLGADARSTAGRDGGERVRHDVSSPPAERARQVIDGQHGATLAAHGLGQLTVDDLVARRRQPPCAWPVPGCRGRR